MPIKTKKKGGRPSKYNQDLQDKFNDLIDAWKAKDYFKFGDVNQVAYQLGINTDTIYDWKRKFPRFSESIKRWETKGRSFLFQKTPTLARDSQSYCIFLAKVKLGYIETNRFEHSGEIKGGDTTVNIKPEWSARFTSEKVSNNGSTDKRLLHAGTGTNGDRVKQKGESA